MRRIISIRRRRFSGVLLCAAVSWVGLGMGFDIRSGMIAKDFRSFFEERLTAVFSDKEVRIARIEGGIFNKLTVDEFSIAARPSKNGQAEPAFFSVDRIIIKYDLADLLRRRFDRLGDLYLISPRLSLPSSPIGGLHLPAGTASFAQGSAAFPHLPRCHILNGSIIGPDRKALLTDLVGTVSFRRSTLFLDHLRGLFMNMPVEVTGSIKDPLRSPVIRLRLKIDGGYYTARVWFKGIDRTGGCAVRASVTVLKKREISCVGKINVATRDRIVVRDLVFNKGLLAVSGDLRIPSRSGRFIVRTRSGPIKLTAALAGPGKTGLRAHASLSHLKIFGFDLMSQVDLDLVSRKIAGTPAVLTGSVSTGATILNYRPFKDVRSRFVLKRESLYISSFDLGDEYHLSGAVALRPPYAVNLGLAVVNAYPADWLVFSKIDRTGFISGIMNGHLAFRGPAAAALSNGRVEIRDGNFKGIKFISASIAVNGKGPIISVKDSKIYQEGGFLFIDGDIDLRKFGHRGFFGHIKAKTDRDITWNGWSLSKDDTTAEIKLKKDIDDEVKVNFKTSTATDKMTGAPREQREVGIDYKIQKNDNINVKVKNDSTFVGVEHKVKF